MLITEQRPLSSREISPDWNPTESLLDDIAERKKEKKGRDTILSIDKILYGKFLEDFDENERAFRRFYWTHFIKCPGDLRNKKDFERSGLNPDACANQFLTEEISVLQPRLILTMGKHCSSWILRKAGYPHKWTERVKEELKSVFSREMKIPIVTIGDLSSKLVVFPHPSGKNPLSMFNMELRELIRTEIDH